MPAFGMYRMLWPPKFIIAIIIIRKNFSLKVPSEAMLTLILGHSCCPTLGYFFLWRSKGSNVSVALAKLCLTELFLPLNWSRSGKDGKMVGYEVSFSEL